jgi:hypothetical protein
MCARTIFGSLLGFARLVEWFANRCNLRAQTAREIVGGLYPIAWRLVCHDQISKVCSVISGGQFTVVDPGRMPLVNWAVSEREEIGHRVANFKAHQQRFKREREDWPDVPDRPIRLTRSALFESSYERKAAMAVRSAPQGNPLCLSEIKHARTDDGVRQELAWHNATNGMYCSRDRRRFARRSFAGAR